MTDEAVTAVTFVGVLLVFAVLLAVVSVLGWLARGLNALIRRFTGVDVIKRILGR